MIIVSSVLVFGLVLFFVENNDGPVYENEINAEIRMAMDKRLGYGEDADVDTRAYWVNEEFNLMEMRYSSISNATIYTVIDKRDSSVIFTFEAALSHVDNTMSVYSRTNRNGSMVVDEVLFEGDVHIEDGQLILELWPEWQEVTGYVTLVFTEGIRPTPATTAPGRRNSS